VEDGELGLKLLVPFMHVVKFSTFGFNVLVALLVLFKELPGVLVLSLELLDEPLNFFSLGVQLMLHVGEHNIEVDGFLVVFVGVGARARLS